MNSFEHGFFDELRKLAATSREHMRAANILRLKNPIIHVEGPPAVWPTPHITTNEAGDQVVKFPQSMGPLPKKTSDTLPISKGGFSEAQKGFNYPHEMEEAAHANKLFKERFKPGKHMTYGDFTGYKNPEKPTVGERKRFEEISAAMEKSPRGDRRPYFITTKPKFHGFHAHLSPIIPLNDLARVQNFGESNADSRARFGRNKEEIRAREARERGLGREFLQKRLVQERSDAPKKSHADTRLLDTMRNSFGAKSARLVNKGSIFDKRIVGDIPYDLSARRSKHAKEAARYMQAMRRPEMQLLRKQLPAEFRHKKFNAYFSGDRKMPKWLRKRIEEIYFAKNPRGVPMAKMYGVPQKVIDQALRDAVGPPDRKFIPVSKKVKRSIAATYGVDAKRFGK